MDRILVGLLELYIIIRNESLSHHSHACTRSFTQLFEKLFCKVQNMERHQLRCVALAFNFWNKIFEWDWDRKSLPHPTTLCHRQLWDIPSILLSPFISGSWNYLYIHIYISVSITHNPSSTSILSQRSALNRRNWFSSWKQNEGSS